MGNWEGGWSQRYKGVRLLPVPATRYVPAIGTANIEERIVGSIATAWLNQKEHHGKSPYNAWGTGREFYHLHNTKHQGLK